MRKKIKQAPVGYCIGTAKCYFQTVQGDFQARFRLNPVEDVKALNNRFWAWLEAQYHRRAHSALGGLSPSEVFAKKAAGLRQLPADWQRLFLARAARRVRLDVTVSLEGRLWEVPVHLRGRCVELRYEFFDWSRVEVRLHCLRRPFRWFRVEQSSSRVGILCLSHWRPVAFLHGALKNAGWPLATSQPEKTWLTAGRTFATNKDVLPSASPARRKAV